MTTHRIALALLTSASLLAPATLALSSAHAQDVITIEVPPTAPPILSDATLTVQAKVESAPVFPPVTLAEIKTRAVDALNKRQASLAAITAQLRAARADCGQNQAVLANIAATQTGLLALGAAIAADIDLTKAKNDYRMIFGSFRVYALVVPRTHIALNCDNHLFYGNNLKANGARLAAAIAVAQSRGVDTSVASANLAQALAAIDPAVARDQAAVASVMGLLPDQGNRAQLASNTAALQAARTQEVGADASLDGARSLLKAGWESLRNVRNATHAARVVVRDAEHAAKEADRSAAKALRDAAKAQREAEKDARKAAKHGGGVVVISH